MQVEPEVRFQPGLHLGVLVSGVVSRIICTASHFGTSRSIVRTGTAGYRPAGSQRRRGARAGPRGRGEPTRLGRCHRGAVHREHRHRAAQAAERCAGFGCRGHRRGGRHQREGFTGHGDEVFGSGAGTFAEYAVAAATNVVPKPTTITFERAAAVPMSGLTALQVV
jgi:hypothetical protein